MAFASSDPVTITTAATGLPDSLAFISFGNSADGTAQANGEIDITNQAHLFFVAPRAGTITGFSASISNPNAIAFGPDGATVTAQIYRAESDSNIFQPLDTPKIEFTLPQNVDAGEVFTETVNNLNVAVTAGQKLLLVYSITTPDAAIYTTDFYANAGLTLA